MRQSDAITPGDISDPIVMLTNNCFERFVLPVSKLPNFDLIIIASTDETSRGQSEFFFFSFFISGKHRWLSGWTPTYAVYTL